jgi:hypothetical protein
MKVDPLALGGAARAWDEQHLDLQAAGRQVGAADSSPFTAAVSGTAARFATTWGRFAAALGDQCEEQADGVRTALDEALDADHVTGLALDLVRAATREVR